MYSPEVKEEEEEEHNHKLRRGSRCISTSVQLANVDGLVFVEDLCGY